MIENKKSESHKKRLHQNIARLAKTLEGDDFDKAVMELTEKFELEEKQKEILDSIQYARRIQLAQIPSEKRVLSMFNKLIRSGSN